MFALGVELLMGRAVINLWGSRDEYKARPEWPPHPDRVFMALVAAWGETDERERHGSEVEALEWLERLGPPALAVPGVTSERASFRSYVPVNDSADPVSKGKALAPMGSLPIGRNRQARQYPAVVPDHPVFHLVWRDAELPANLRPALDRICQGVTYLGHSSTPVRVGIASDYDPITITLTPTDGKAPHRLRTFGPGRLKDLRERYELQLRPQPALWHGYAPPVSERPAVAESLFDPGLIVLRQVGGRTFALESAGMIANALRDALMSRWDAAYGTRPAEWLSGHGADDGPSRRHRPAIIPLGFVGREHADGHLLGIGIALPADADFQPADSRQLFDLLARHGEADEVAAEGVGFVRLAIPGPGRGDTVGQLHLELDERPPEKRAYALQPETWTRPASTWATVTPIVLPRFSRRGLSTEDVIAGACRDAGYPLPVAVRVGSAPMLPGVPHVRSFIRPQRPGRPHRPLTHAVIQFGGPIRGPVLLGAGRYLGFGLCRSLAEGDTL
jgi:CRISPR-associated protein Csb2